MKHQLYFAVMHACTRYLLNFTMSSPSMRADLNLAETLRPCKACMHAPPYIYKIESGPTILRDACGKITFCDAWPGAFV